MQQAMNMVEQFHVVHGTTPVSGVALTLDDQVVVTDKNGFVNAENVMT